MIAANAESGGAWSSRWNEVEHAPPGIYDVGDEIQLVIAVSLSDGMCDLKPQL